MWCPPTPPTTDNDVYIDYTMSFLYEDVPMTEAQLPPIYVKKERNRSRIETNLTDDGESIVFIDIVIYIIYILKHFTKVITL